MQFIHRWWCVQGHGIRFSSVCHVILQHDQEHTAQGDREGRPYEFNTDACCSDHIAYDSTAQLIVHGDAFALGRARHVASEARQHLAAIKLDHALLIVLAGGTYTSVTPPSISFWID